LALYKVVDERKISLARCETFKLKDCLRIVEGHKAAAPIDESIKFDGIGSEGNETLGKTYR